MTTNKRTAWHRFGDAARVLGDAVATPRGTAPDRALGRGALRSERF